MCGNATCEGKCQAFVDSDNDSMQTEFPTSNPSAKSTIGAFIESDDEDHKTASSGEHITTEEPVMPSVAEEWANAVTNIQPFLQTIQATESGDTNLNWVLHQKLKPVTETFDDFLDDLLVSLNSSSSVPFRIRSIEEAANLLPSWDDTLRSCQCAKGDVKEIIDLLNTASVNDVAQRMLSVRKWIIEANAAILNHRVSWKDWKSPVKGAPLVLWLASADQEDALGMTASVHLFFVAIQCAWDATERCIRLAVREGDEIASDIDKKLGELEELFPKPPGDHVSRRSEIEKMIGEWQDPQSDLFLHFAEYEHKGRQIGAFIAWDVLISAKSIHRNLSGIAKDLEGLEIWWKHE